MGSYFKHTQTKSVNVQYAFRCEQCLKESGPQTATISASAEINTLSRVLSDREQRKLNGLSHAALVRAVKTAYQEAVDKHMYDGAFRDECPYCHQPQSWAISKMQDDQFIMPIAILIVGIIVSLGVYFFTDGKSIPLALGIFAAGILIASGFLLRNRIKIRSKQKAASSAMEHNLPSIQWEAVQDLLDAR